MLIREIGRRLVGFFWGVTPLGRFIRLCIYTGVVCGYALDMVDIVLGFYFIAAVTASMGYFIYMALEASRQQSIMQPKKAAVKITRRNRFKFKK